MKKIRLIYNPASGDRSFKNRLDHLFEEFQRADFEVIPYKTLGVDDIDRAVKLSLEDDYHALVVAGGDGTLNRVVNSMKKYKLDVPVGIFPWGTANDLATYLKIPRDIKKCCQYIIDGNIRSIDLGIINDRYFVNVAAGGLLTDISQKIDLNLKNTLGKLAYYLKGLEQLPNFKPIPTRFISSEFNIKEDIYLFMVFNGCSAGGFEFFGKEAKLDDGKLDVVGIKACTITDLIGLFLKILRGEHLSDSNIISIKTDKLRIECECDTETDIDGEAGPRFPVDINVIPKGLKIFVPPENDFSSSCF